MPRIIKPVEMRKKEILIAAKELFFLKGYNDTSISDIVKKIGIAQGLFYHYFQSKDEVFRVVMEEFSDDIIKKLKNIVSYPNSSLKEKIEKIYTILLNADDGIDHSLLGELHLLEHKELHSRLMLRVAEEMKEDVKIMLRESGLENFNAAAYFLTFGSIGIINELMDMKEEDERKAYMQDFLSDIQRLLQY